MKRILKVLTALLCLMTLSFGCAALAEEETMQLPAPVFTLPVGAGSVEIQTEWIEEELWLFLPAFAQLEQLSVEGAELEWWDMEADEEGLWYVDVALDEEVYEVSVMRSQNLRTLFLFSDDPVNQGRAFVEDKSTKHENEAPASLALVSAQGEVQHAQHIEKLRGRGNGTWETTEKISYQLKLDYSVDLLDTGDSANRARKWLLLAEAVDATMLRNHISMDIGRELGLEVMESEFIDLYYDGSYRGTYRLSEKVEVGEGRVDVLDYDELLETWNSKLGQHDLEKLPAAQAENRFGSTFTYIEGIVDNQLPNSGGYVVEMESVPYTLSDRCYFRLSDSPDTQVYALKSPGNASRQAVQYVSERLQEAQNTLRAGGVNLGTGATAAEEFDLEAFARTLLVQEFSGNVDGYTYSSSFFVLPEGETRFEPGPLWDLDLAYRLWKDGRNEGAAGFKDSTGWLIDFYLVPEFMELAQKIYLEELYPLVQNVLLGDQAGRYLRSLDAYVETIAASQRMNDMLWEPGLNWRFYYADTLEGEIRHLRLFMDQRSEWLYNAFSDLHAAEENQIILWTNIRYANPDDSIRFFSVPWQDYAAQVISAHQLTEATEEEYACWEMEAVVSAADGRSLEGYTVVLNGTRLTSRLQEDGSLLIRAEYDDQTYRSVDYYGEDMGLIYDYQRYIMCYPEVAEACGYDEQAVMDYFFDEGIYEGHAGNAFFDPRNIAALQPYVADYLYDDWSMYYWEFLDWGFEADWLENTVARFVPAITNIP